MAIEMNENRLKRNRLLSETILKNLRSRNMDGAFAESKEDALRIALSRIPEGSSVTWGGTASAAEIGLKKALIEGNYNALDRDTAADKRAAELFAYDADFFIASANALSEDGIIINIDGHANRVSAIAAGPRNVLLIVGMNKVVKDADAALSRARNEAAPINAQRFGIDTPCAKTGTCHDCRSPQCICAQILITRFSQVKGRIFVVLVNEALGF